MSDDRHDASTADLLRRLSEQTSRLVRDELELARAELTAKGRRAGLGAGMFGGAGLLGVFALGALTAAGIAALDLVVATWLAALIVAAVWAAGAGVLALTGRREVRQAMPPVPPDRVASVKEDVRWTKQRAQDAGR